MPLLYDYTDYRSFLKDWFAERKSLGFPLSYRSLGQKLGIDPGFLVNILQGNKHTTEASIPKWLKLLKLTTPEAAYFQQLALFNRARSQREIQQHFQRLCELRDLSMQDASERQYRYYLKWHYPAVRVNLLAFPYRGEIEELASRIDPPITPAEAQEAIDTLLSLGLVAWTPEGVLEPVSAFLNASGDWKNKAVLEFQDQTLELARRSLRQHDASVREVSTLTLAIPAAEIPTLQELVREFRQKVLHWTASLDSADSVLQVNIAAFPLSSLPPEAKK